MTTSLLVQLTVPSAETDGAIDELWSLGVTGVEVRQAADVTVLIAGLPTAPASRSVALSLAGRYPTELLEVDDDSWRDVWRQYAEPVDVGSLVVVPAWRPVPVPCGRVILQIDPGPCFGSGSHATTRLLLAEIERWLRPGDRVLDVGTGSGILAVTAAVLGASRVTAVDIDAGAVAVTRANAARNGVAGRVDASTGSVPATGLGYDLVMANLTAAVLADLAGALVAAVGPVGLLAVSGLLSSQWQHLATRFDRLDLLARPELEGWTAAVWRVGDSSGGC